MFLKKNILKRLMKQAYKGNGLTVGHSDDGIRKGYYMGGPTWKAWFDEEHMPKEIKAAIIELCGELPVHEQFLSTKEGNQQEVPTCNFNLPQLYEEAEVQLHTTRFLRDTIAGMIRVMQPTTATDISYVDEDIRSMIDASLIAADAGEPQLELPCAASIHPGWIYWGNTWCYLALKTIEFSADSVMGEQEATMWSRLSQFRLN